MRAFKPYKKSFAAGLSILSLCFPLPVRNSGEQATLQGTPETLVSITQWKAGELKHKEMAHGLTESNATFTDLNRGLISVLCACHRYFWIFSLTTDGFLTAGSFLAFPWHFSPTSLFICNSGGRGGERSVEVVKSFKIIVVTLTYFHGDKQPKPTCYADDKTCRERCFCTYEDQGGFFLRVQKEIHEAGNSDIFTFLVT